MLSAFDNGIILAAREFAANKHEGQVRRWTLEPYVEHCYRVGGMVAKLTSDDEVVAAALVHDVLEDTDTHPAEIELLLGKRVARIATALRNEYTSKRYPHLNRHERKSREALRLSQESRDVRLIKLCDRLDNLRNLHEMEDHEFRDTYIAETHHLIAMIFR